MEIEIGSFCNVHAALIHCPLNHNHLFAYFPASLYKYNFVQFNNNDNNRKTEKQEKLNQGIQKRIRNKLYCVCVYAFSLLHKS